MLKLLLNMPSLYYVLTKVALDTSLNPKHLNWNNLELLDECLESGLALGRGSFCKAADG